MPIINTHLPFNKCSGCDTAEGIQLCKTRGKEEEKKQREVLDRITFII